MIPLYITMLILIIGFGLIAYYDHKDRKFMDEIRESSMKQRKETPRFVKKTWWNHYDYPKINK